MPLKFIPWNKHLIVQEYKEKPITSAVFESFAKAPSKGTSMLVEAVSTPWGGNSGSLYLVLSNMVERHVVLGEEVLSVPESAIICEVKKES